MASRDSSIRALAKQLGKEYRVTVIDFEPVVYRDFGNGYNVEISEMYTMSKKKKATLYLWNGDTIGSHTIKILRGVERENIGAEVEALYEYTKTLTKSESDNAKEDK